MQCLFSFDISIIKSSSIDIAKIIITFLDNTTDAKVVILTKRDLPFLHCICPFDGGPAAGRVFWYQDGQGRRWSNGDSIRWKILEANEPS